MVQQHTQFSDQLQQPLQMHLRADCFGPNWTFLGAEVIFVRFLNETGCSECYAQSSVGHTAACTAQRRCIKVTTVPDDSEKLTRK
jgi:hypothetical protein